jgi:hypothetical protein
MILRFFLLILILSAFKAAPAGKDVRIFDIRLTPQNLIISADTSGWNNIEDFFNLTKNFTVRTPEAACGLFTETGRALFSVKKLSAISLGILVDLGCDLVVLSRWYGIDNTKLPAEATTAKSAARAAQSASGYLWERVSGYRVTDTSAVAGSRDQLLEIYFAGHGRSTFFGRDNVDNSFKRILGSRPYETPVDTDLIGRHIIRVFIVAGRGESAHGVAGRVEKVMTNLGLGLDYRAPSITAVSCIAPKTEKEPLKSTENPVRESLPVAKPDTMTGSAGTITEETAGTAVVDSNHSSALPADSATDTTRAVAPADTSKSPRQ